ncbi:MAG: guanylate kinase, partial [Chloroflexi bacterium]|nr:guanylate kinase [Chloroflexota bacterium]
MMMVLSGPSGVGKDAVLSRIRELGYSQHIVVTATTRTIRPTEKDGVDYIFLDQDTFDKKVADNEFLEWAEVYGNCYGVPKDQVREAISSGQDVIIKADVQGAATIKKLNPYGVFVFLAPPSFQDLEKRLRVRKTEAQIDLERSLETARGDMQHLPLFDYVVVNADGALDDAVAALESIIQ